MDPCNPGPPPDDSGTSLLWAGVDSSWLITAPSATHATQIGSSPQPTSGTSEPYPPTTTTRTMSAKPATHAPAHAAVRSQVRRRQPRSRTNPANSKGTASSTQATAASTPTPAITPGSPLYSGNQNSSLVHWLVVHPCMEQTKA